MITRAASAATWLAFHLDASRVRPRFCPESRSNDGQMPHSRFAKAAISEQPGVELVAR